MIRSETMREKIERIQSAAKALDPPMRTILLQQSQLLEDRVAEFNAGGGDRLRSFKLGFLLATNHALNMMCIALTHDLTLWIDGDKLVEELEVEQVREELRVDE